MGSKAMPRDRRAASISPKHRRLLLALRGPLEREAARQYLVEFVQFRGRLSAPIGAHQQEWSNALGQVVEGKINRLLMLAPRGHGKSSWATEEFVAWSIGRNPNIRALLVGGAPYRVVRAARRVRSIIQTDPKFRALFGRLGPITDGSPARVPGQKWAEAEFTVRRTADLAEPTVVALGAGATIPGHRCDLVIADDLVHDKNTSQDQREKLAEWFDKALLPALQPDGAMVVIGTRWHYADLYQRLIDSGLWTLIQHKAILDEEKGLVLWPEHFPFETLMQRRKEMGEILFGCQYQNDPSGLKGQLLKGEWIHWYERGEEPSRDSTVIFIGVDPAISEAATADYFALVVVAMDDDRNIWVMDTYRGRLDFPAQIEMIRSKAAQWDPSKVAIEDVAYQLSLVQVLMRESNLRVVGRKTTQNKTARLTAMGPHFENGRIRVRRDMRELEAEYLAFPRGAHDDLLDALELAVEAALDTRQPRLIVL
jgi:predicted phage terminase large subunit-like protein